MAKRFSETKIWDDIWYQDLSAEWKLLWKYVCDKCDEAGIWKVNKPLAEFQLKTSIKWDETDKWLNNGKKRIDFRNDFWIINDFVSFQYGDKIFNSNHPFHIKIRKMLDRVSHRVYYTLTEKEKEKEKEKDKEKGIVKGKGNGDGKPAQPPPFDEYSTNTREQLAPNISKDNISKDNISKEHPFFSFEEIYLKYPNKVGKKEALKHFQLSVKTEDDWQNIQKALENYLKSERVKKGFIQNASTWFNNWRDWITPPIKEKTGIEKYIRED